ncbi:DUF4158 domain-containing protein [Paraburkholderia aspalathi]|uniref:DUF4158 domain-containing protein n=1 Tax=Paraburkholderia aspalathi TaxID=1324617 RepID=UPI0038BBFEF8
MRAHNKNLTLLPEAERQALYDRPDFDDFQRAEYFAFTSDELALAQQRAGLPEQILCLLQIGYFKAKQAFFTLALADCPPEDLDFLCDRYFPTQPLYPRPVRRAEHHAQRQEILRLFGYRWCAAQDSASLAHKAEQLVRRDVTPAFVLTELVAWLNQHHIVRPGYTAFQTVISVALSKERQRLAALINPALTDDLKVALQSLLVREETLSELAAIKQDAKHFGARMMGRERQKRASLEAIYRAARVLLPRLDLSPQNVAYYASLAHYYTIYDLRRLQPGQTSLYLLCYAWQRYRQLNDNLVDALRYQTKKFEDGSKASAEHQFMRAQVQRQKETTQVGQLLLLYVDDKFDDATPFGSVRHRAFSIMPKAALQLVGQRLSNKTVSEMELRWQAVDALAGQVRARLRPQAMALDFSSISTDDPWLAAVRWMSGVFGRRQRLDQRPLAEVPPDTLPKRLRAYLLTFDDTDQATGLRGNRYEFWVYRQLRKRLDSGELYLDDSIQHRRFSDHLVALDRTTPVLEELQLAWLRQPPDRAIDALCDELDDLWRSFDRELRQGKLKHLDYDAQRKQLTWHRPKADKEDRARPFFREAAVAQYRRHHPVCE